MITVSNVTKNIKTLSRSVLYEKDYFLNSIKAKEIIQQKLKQENFNLGLMVVFGFANVDKLPQKLGNYSSNFIIKKLLEKIVKSFQDKEVIFYMTKENQYACFFFLKELDLTKLNLIYQGNNLSKRMNSDPFFDIYKKLQDIPNEVVYNDTSEKIKLNTSGAIYGVHSCQLEHLESLCINTKNTVLYNTKKNILQIYNPNTVMIANKKYTEIKSLNKYFGQNDFEINLKVNKYIHFNKKITLQPLVSSVNHLLFNFESIADYAKEHKIYEITMRFLAMQCLQEFVKNPKNKKNKIIIPYCWQTLVNPNFNVSWFIKKIRSLNINPANVILRINLDDVHNLNYGIFDKLKELQTYEINFYWYNFDETNLKLLKFIKPDLVSLKPYRDVNLKQDSVQIDLYYKTLIDFLQEQAIEIVKEY
ncbi:hypothetical protein UREOM_5440 [Ureaplasma sp. OM1]|uniref:EAL domain-containing protein n=2 Tax=Ureaplasma ceti TaxID=3119530 RepID=A0ABP9U668_9BACT